MRGSPPTVLEFEFPRPDLTHNEVQRGPQVGDRFLVFFRLSDRNDVRWEYFINLTQPAKIGWVNVAIRPDFSVLLDGKQIESVVAERIKFKSLSALRWQEFPQDRLRVQVPFDAPAAKALWSGSAVYLMVPNDLLWISQEKQQQFQGRTTDASTPR